MKMIKIIKLKNGYGIKDLKINLGDGTDKELGNHIIYAPNGVFKTSFAKTISMLAEGKGSEVLDRLEDKPLSCVLEVNGLTCTENDTLENVIVFSKELLALNVAKLGENSDLATLAVSENAIKELESIKEKTKPMIFGVIGAFKDADLVFEKVSKVTNLPDVLSVNGLLEVCKAIDSGDETLDTSKVRIKNLTQKTYDVIDTEDFKKLAESYLLIVNNKLKGLFFDEEFNDQTALQIISILQESAFLNEKRYVSIYGVKYTNIDQLKTKIAEEIEKISDDEVVFKERDKLIKMMGSAKEAEALRQEIRKDPAIVGILATGRMNIVMAYVKKKCQFDIESYVAQLEMLEKDVKKIRKSAENSKTDFDEAIRVFKTRFRPVFDIEITNKDYSVFGETLPTIEFHHCRKSDLSLAEDQLRLILSSGEKTALDIIRFIVKYERLKEKEPVIILDDIIETFDYCNRAAFIRYINDAAFLGCGLVVLTHNYEFFRTLRTRCKDLIGLVAETSDGVVTIRKDRHINLKIDKMFVVNDEKSFLTAIPYAREIYGFQPGADDASLANCLHFKNDTHNLTLQDVCDEIKRILPWFDVSRVPLPSFSKNYIDLLQECARSTARAHIDFFDLPSKVLLAIACRVLLEKKIINGSFVLLDGIEENQTSEIAKKYSDKLNPIASDLFDLVLLFTPEFVHINTFMYEPLIDIPPHDLKELYIEIEKLDPKDVWKP